MRGETKAEGNVYRNGVKGTGLRDGGSAGGEDFVGMWVGEENDDGEVIDEPIIAQIDAEIDGSAERQCDRMQFLELANHGGVLQSFAGIFSRLDVGT